MVLTSTQVDEDARQFYRKLGYKDCGGFTIDVPGYEQPMELFMVKQFYHKDKSEFTEMISYFIRTNGLYWNTMIIPLPS